MQPKLLKKYLLVRSYAGFFEAYILAIFTKKMHPREIPQIIFFSKFMKKITMVVLNQFSGIKFGKFLG
jgi:hypothetical protein